MESRSSAGTKDKDGSANGKTASGTLQEKKDEQEKRKHPASENALETTQDKNPVPGGSRR
jgi:hypothetical protein